VNAPPVYLVGTMSSDDFDRDLRPKHVPPQRERLTDEHLRRRYDVAKRHFINDTVVKGFALQITPTGHRSLVFRYRHKGKTDKHTFRDGLSVSQARTMAGAMQATLKLGDNPKFKGKAAEPQGGKSLREVLRDYLALHRFKSQGEFARSLHNHVLPTLGDRPYESITRQDLAKLRDDITVNAGRHAAHYALRCLGAIWNKYARDHSSDRFTWPQVRSPLGPEDRNGKGRMLSEREVREVWRASFRLAPNKGAYIRFLFLTGLRRSSAARITRAQIAPDWSLVHIPGVTRKPAYDLILSEPARGLLREYFPEDARWAFEHLSSYSSLKAELDIQVGQIAPWRLHDIRHTVRSLLSRVTTPDIAELCVGHALRGMRQVYDHHLYEGEKKAAMEALASLLAKIVEGSGSPGEGSNALIRGA
jgi:integrase